MGICDNMNAKFQSKFITKDIEASTLKDWGGRVTTYNIIIRQYIYRLIKGLNPYKAHGSYGILPYVLMESAGP